MEAGKPSFPAPRQLNWIEGSYNIHGVILQLSKLGSQIDSKLSFNEQCDSILCHRANFMLLSFIERFVLQMSSKGERTVLLHASETIN